MGEPIQLDLPETLVEDVTLCDACEARERARIVTIIADACGQLEVISAWYEQATESEERLGLVSLRLTTHWGGFSRGLGRLGPESLREARRIAGHLGLDLIAHEPLREMVAGWVGGSDG